MKTEARDVTLIAVGGGAFLVPDRLAGISEVVRVPHGDCANAVGAATAQIGVMLAGMRSVRERLLR
jgi:hypothetical protein